jgi:hypothetical protein
VLNKVIASLKAASERHYKVLQEAEAEARKWRDEGDMYGWNYHAGRGGGCYYTGTPLTDKVDRVLRLGTVEKGAES